MAEKTYEFESVTMVTLTQSLAIRPAILLRGKNQEIPSSVVLNKPKTDKKDSGGSPMSSACLSETEACSARLTLGANTLPGSPGEAAELLKA